MWRCTALIAVGAPLAVLPAATAAQGLPGSTPEAVGLDGAALARITPALQAYVDSARLGGVVAAVARHGKVAYLQPVGFADRDAGTPLRPDALFYIASMTKPITAVTALRLVEQGKLDLDAPVAKYLPAFADVKVYAGGSAAEPTLRAPRRAMTVRDLFTHTAGLSYASNFDADGLSPVDTLLEAANLYSPARTLAEMVDTLARFPLLSSPGERWRYSYASDVLGRVAEVAAGLPFDRLVEEQVLRPLGMRDTQFRPSAKLVTRIPRMYARTAGGELRAVDVVRRPAPGEKVPEWHLVIPGGGLVSTVGDYLRFAQMLLNGGALDGARILKPETVALMTRNHLRAEQLPIQPKWAGQPGYGFGLGVAVLVDPAASGLPGNAGIFRWWGYFNTYFWVDPAADLIGMVWTQSSPPRGLPLEQDFQRLVYAALRTEARPR